tara:strand:- start:7863 stop:8732 length:870 start_codon:yes stop_codon:yes gene_type:complete
MILVDLNQVMISNLMMQLGSNKNAPIDEDLVRHMVLNSLRMYRQKFGEEYGTFVLCCDDKKYWRKDVFPYYKAHRKKDRQESGLDWYTIFSCIDKIKDELRQFFPYKVIKVAGAEADDVIGALCEKFGHLGITNGSAEPILILSGDKDFIQLQKYANVEQYSPIAKKFIRTSNPAAFIKEHIMRGDRGDGIPNFLSDDNTFVSGKRQKPLTAKKLNTWIGLEPEEFCNDDMLDRYKRNQELVDLDFIPPRIKEEAVSAYEEYDAPGREHLLNYFIKNRLKNLMDHIGDF